MNDWHQTKFKLPERNEQKLIFRNNIWWFLDFSMYVYYTPTHWKNISL